MSGLEILRNPDTTAEQIADIIAEHCPPITPEHCDKLSCRKCWLAWLTTGEPPKEKGPSDKQTAPRYGVSSGERLLEGERLPHRYRFNVVIEDDKLPELKRFLELWMNCDVG